MPSNAPPPLPRRRRGDRAQLARDPSVRPIDISRGASLVTQNVAPLWHPHCPAQKPAFPLARRRRALHIASCTAALDVQRRTLPTHIPARLDVRPRACHLGTSPRSPPMHDAPASKIVCSRCRRLTRMRAMGDAPSHRLPAPSPTRGRYGYREWGHAARMRTGVIRAKEKDERGRHFHGCSTYGSTTTARRAGTRQAFPPVSWSSSTLRENVSEQQLPLRPLPLRTPLDDF
ncbi:hypothetical protein B0H14DRAFT_3072679 [Mycena olivaceomarginata]|nr:hypothetical protein B0H14DRAFT_3072679 [Mycena olivaceomarginata]